MNAPVSTDVRRLTAADAEAYRAIRLESLRSAPDAFASTYKAEKDRPMTSFEKRLEDSVVYGCGPETALTGLCGYVVQQGDTQHHKGLVWGMYVTPAERRKGLGKKLLAAVIADARTRLEILQLGVGLQNRPARTLYDAAGFREYGVEHHAMKLDDDRYIDEVLMSLRLR